MRTASGLTSIVTAVLCGVVSAGCGASAPTAPKVPSQSGAGGDQVVLVVNGQSFEERESGSVQVKVSGAPELNHDGPVGCRGRYFESDNGPFDFRYTAHEAWLLYQQSHLFHFGEGPARRAGFLVWSARFGRDQVAVRVHCPLPRA